ncbi:MAG: hypothetical protein AAFV90_24555 [Cyanobacteria bacterium J06634_5]
MKPLILGGLFLSIFAIVPPSIAQTTHTVEQNNQTTVPLYRGQGITLNFRPTGETIQRAWLDDPSQTTLDFDDSRCAAAEAEGCAASVIHLRRINPINFPGLPTTDVTSLTVLTDGELYSFRLTFPETGTPSYSVLDIQPEREAPSVAPAASPVISQMTRTEGLEAIEQGLNESLVKGLIDRDSSLWTRAQTFLSLMREGLPAQEAAHQAGISQELVLRLAEIGQPNTNVAI